MWKKGDVLLVLVLIVVILSAFTGTRLYYGKEANEAVIAVIRYYDGRTEKIDLSAVKEPRQIKVPGNYDEIIQVEKGRIRFLEANCPDKICVDSGWLQKNGDIAVCLPNYTMISIQGGTDGNKVDGGTF